jgi:hypothetical protein
MQGQGELIDKSQASHKRLHWVTFNRTSSTVRIIIRQDMRLHYEIASRLWLILEQRLRSAYATGRPPGLHSPPTSAFVQTTGGARSGRYAHSVIR